MKFPNGLRGTLLDRVGDRHDADERAVKLREWTQALFNLRLQKATGQLENPIKIRQLRRDIARLKTAERQAR